MLPSLLRKYQPRFCCALVFALVGQPCLAIDAPVKAGSATNQQRVAQVADVSLKQSGVLIGQVVDHAGVGIAKRVVQFSNGQQHFRVNTDSEGWFRIEGLRGGTYQLQTVGHSQVLRVWSAGTAPPHASQGVLISPTTDVVRGQRVLSPRTNQFFRFTKHKLTNPWVVGGVVATAVTIPVAIHNADDDDPPATP